MNREEVLAHADEFLSRICDQINYTTVPKILNDCQIPDYTLAAVFRSVEEILVEYDLVEPDPEETYTPGGFWLRLRLSPKGYDLVASRISIRQILPDEEITYNCFRTIFKILCRHPGESLVYQKLKEKAKASGLRRRSLKNDIRHFVQLGWLTTNQTGEDELVVRLGLNASQYFANFQEGIQWIRLHPYSTALITTEVDDQSNYYFRSKIEQYRANLEKRNKYREINRLLCPGVPIGYWQKLLFHTTCFGKRWYGPKKIYPEGSTVLSNKQREKLSRFTNQEIESTVVFIVISCLIIFIIKAFGNWSFY